MFSWSQKCSYKRVVSKTCVLASSVHSKSPHSAPEEGQGLASRSAFVPHPRDGHPGHRMCARRCPQHHRVPLATPGHAEDDCDTDSTVHPQCCPQRRKASVSCSPMQGCAGRTDPAHSPPLPFPTPAPGRCRQDTTWRQPDSKFKRRRSTGKTGPELRTPPRRSPEGEGGPRPEELKVT